MIDLLIRKEARVLLDKLRVNLPQSILITGPAGVGLLTIAKAISNQHGQPEIIRPEKRTSTSTGEQISIEQIRELYERTRSKRDSSQVIIIDDADMMSVPAQNSFLKLLEEPNQHTRFILTSHHPELLIPTVRSRLQTHHIAPVGDAETLDFINETFPKLSGTKKNQVTFIAGGRPAEITRLIQDDEYFRSASERMKLVRTLLEGSRYQRLIGVASLKSITKSECLALIDSMLLVLQRNPSSNIEFIARLLKAYERVISNGNPRLQLVASMV